MFTREQSVLDQKMQVVFSVYSELSNNTTTRYLLNMLYNTQCGPYRKTEPFEYDG